MNKPISEMSIKELDNLIEDDKSPNHEKKEAKYQKQQIVDEYCKRNNPAHTCASPKEKQ